MTKNNKSISLTLDLTVNIEGKDQCVILAIEYHPSVKNYYYINAITETGFDLCNSNYGYFNYCCPRLNTRLHSEKSIANDMLFILDCLADSIRNIANDIILSGREVEVTISGTECYAPIPEARFFPASNIRSKQSGSVLSWYEHNVFSQGKLMVSVYRQTDGQLRFEADEKQLYDLGKLQFLYGSVAFKESKLAFFFYNECRRLLGIPVTGDASRMSGLMDIGRTE